MRLARNHKAVVAAAIVIVLAAVGAARGTVGRGGKSFPSASPNSLKTSEILRRTSGVLKDSMATLDIYGPWLFLRSLLRDPVAMGAVVPSSPRLSKLIASRVDTGTATILEVGAGTGSITGALLARGIKPERVFVIERDPELAAYLQDRFPRIRVRCGDALDASSILADECVDKVDTLLSSLPVRNFKPREQLVMLRAMFKALTPSGQLIQYTYGSSCPFPGRALGLTAERVGRVWMNVPPAAVWRFTRSHI